MPAIVGELRVRRPDRRSAVGRGVAGVDRGRLGRVAQVPVRPLVHRDHADGGGNEHHEGCKRHRVAAPPPARHRLLHSVGCSSASDVTSISRKSIGTTMSESSRGSVSSPNVRTASRWFDVVGELERETARSRDADRQRTPPERFRSLARAVRAAVDLQGREGEERAELRDDRLGVEVDDDPVALGRPLACADRPCAPHVVDGDRDVAAFAALADVDGHGEGSLEGILRRRDEGDTPRRRDQGPADPQLTHRLMRLPRCLPQRSSRSPPRRGPSTTGRSRRTSPCAGSCR